MLPYHNTQIKHQNPGASMPLILPVHLICNTADEALYENIRQNSRLRKQGISLQEPHDRIAVVCGSGPSLGDHLEQIRKLSIGGGGADIFALNGAARFLDREARILPDAQIIIDAREETAQLVGPAKKHLFASQVHPRCFERAPEALLWHLQIEGIDDCLPPQEENLCLIGGAASVGNTALCLLYALGYRRLELFGYDSSHREGHSHAFEQKMNAGEPCAWVEFAGKQYLCSLTMKLQAERFQNTALALRRAGCRIRVHGTGLLPAMYNAPLSMSEQEKYERMWLLDDYREISPGEHSSQLFLEVVQPRPGELIRDFGCGTGRGGLRFSARGFAVELLDFAGNCRDPEALLLPFTRQDLSQPIEPRDGWGYCCDVMEHIPGEQVDVVLRNMLAATKGVFFQISTTGDGLGELLGQELHLTVQPAAWWLRKFEDLGYKVLWTKELSNAVQLFVKGDLKWN